MTKADDKIIVELDVATKKTALDLVEQLRSEISFFKIGLQLYTAEGPEIVRAVLATGAKVWLDLKLYDIPNTVARAVESASTLGVQMLTIHLSGGSDMKAWPRSWKNSANGCHSERSRGISRCFWNSRGHLVFARHEEKGLHRAAHLSRRRPECGGDEYGDR